VSKTIFQKVDQSMTSFWGGASVSRTKYKVLYHYATFLFGTSYENFTWKKQQTLPKISVHDIH
jgi:hypothetical protein